VPNVDTTQPASSRRRESSMPPVLKQLIGRQPDARALVAAIADALGSAITVADADGRVLYGDGLASPDNLRVPVTHQEAPVGWVEGPRHARTVAALLDHLVARDAEKKALGGEVLHLYREINLIYSFSEKLAALLELERVARLTLDEARHVIVATDGVLLLLDEDAEILTAVAGFGDELPTLDRLRRGHGIVGAVAASGVGEVVNDVALDARRAREHTKVRGLICAPLKVGERTIGVLALGSTDPMPYTAAELKLLTTLALQTATAIENARLFERTMEAARERERLMALHQQAELARAKLEGELTLAARIQGDLFPAVLPRLEGYELAARNRPARQCGGDYYDVLRVSRDPVPNVGQGSLPSVGQGFSPANGLLLCVADVSGKGLPAALVMSNMQATLRALIGRTSSLAELAAQASELLFAATPPEKYVTAALVELAPASGALTFVGAGHLDNMVLRASGDVEALVSTGTPLGLFPSGSPYDQSAHQLDPGDALVLFSDGVTEAQNTDGDEFGEARLFEVLRACPGQPGAEVIDRVFAAIDAFAAGAPQFDDITVLVARRLGERPAVRGAGL
jgi:serine phosphatase RsbU (regulator of sigma subunit)